jgi:hypothetical protein
MTIQNEVVKTRTYDQHKQTLNVAELAENIIEHAFSHANRKLIGSDAKNNEEYLAQRNYLEIFRSGLCNSVAEALVENDSSVISIFRFDPNANPDGETEEDLTVDGNVYLIAVVEKLSKALVDFANSLDRAITERLNEFPQTIFKKYSSVLDLKFVTPEEIENRRGFGILLTSVFSPPAKLWERE